MQLKMNVSDESYNKIKSAIVMSVKEALKVTRSFGLDENQIDEFDMKESENMIQCCLEFPREADELIELQNSIFDRHCILMDIHDQLQFILRWNPKWRRLNV
jgi:hypothetical protein